MSTLQVGDEPLPQAVAARLRGLLAERKISHKEFGEMVGWNRGIYQRRLSGEIPLDLLELEHIERTTGITVAFLLTGIEAELPPPPPSPQPPNPFRRPPAVGVVHRLRPADAGFAGREERTLVGVQADDEIDDAAVHYVTSFGKPDNPTHQPVDQLPAPYRPAQAA